MVTPIAAVESTIPVVVDPQIRLGEPVELPEPTPETAVLPPVTDEAATTSPERPTEGPDATQQELAFLRRQLAQVEADKAAQLTESLITKESQQVLRDALARGLSEEDANWMAQRHYTLAHSVHQERETLREQQQIMQGKINAAMQFGKRYGVSPSMLMSAGSPEEMRAVGEREQRYAAQEARLKALEQSRVQPQTLDSGVGSRAGSVAATGDTIDKLWVEYDRAHPDNPNPYDAQYRRFLGR